MKAQGYGTTTIGKVIFGKRKVLSHKKIILVEIRNPVFTSTYKI
jgi:hypothetical protein